MPRSHAYYIGTRHLRPPLQALEAFSEGSEGKSLVMTLVLSVSKSLVMTLVLSVSKSLVITLVLSTIVSALRKSYVVVRNGRVGE
jgi:hypothetical protein